MVLVFRHADGAWVQEAVLESPGGETGTGFGGTLAMTGDLLVVGATQTDSAAGAAYVYENGADGWTMTAELTSDGGPGAWFGAEALVVGDHILVAAGSPFRQAAGTVTTFARQDGEWAATGTFMAFDGGVGDMFGASMASDGNTLWIGAGGLDSRRGAIYEFAADANGDWTSVSKITVPDPQPGDGLGRVVAHGGDILVSGMPGDDYGAGTALIFERDGEGWTSERVPSWRQIAEFDPVVGGQLDCSEGAGIRVRVQRRGSGRVPSGQRPGRRSAAPASTTSGGGPIRRPERDYALVGRMDGTSFVDVTDPANPVVVGNLPKTRRGSGDLLARHEGVWRPRVRGMRTTRRNARHAGLRPNPVA